MKTVASQGGSQPCATTSGLIGLARSVRNAGVGVGVGQTEALCRAASFIDCGSRCQVHHAARAVLVHRREDLPIFEEAFERFWPDPTTGGAPRKAPRAPREEPMPERKPALVAYMAEKAATGAPELDVDDRRCTWSVEERIQRRDFVAMTPEELQAVERFLAEMDWRVARRRTRRRIPDRRGETLDLRRACAHAGRHGGHLLTLPRRSRKIKPRPMVLLADISGSMELYSRVLMQLFHSVGRSVGGVESFVFSTRLTRITSQLASRSVARALQEVTADVVDWAGGTRIGQCLSTFNRVWAPRTLRRGAVVLMVSDGWDRGDVELLQRELRFLHDRCYRLIWLNPLLAGRDYEPRVEGMRAALPFIDDFLPVHDLHSLRSLAERLSLLAARRVHRASAPAGRSGGVSRRHLEPFAKERFVT